MIRRVLLAGSVLALAAPALAQRPVDTPEERRLRNQLQTFEVVLMTAVRQGGDDFARSQGDTIPPGVQLTSEEPQVKGLAPPHGGNLAFIVVVPPIRALVANQLWVLRAPRSLQPTAGRGSAGPGRATTGAQGLIATPDPTAVSPVVEDGKCATRTKPSAGFPNPNYEYAVAVCDALMDAMLDNSGALPIKENEWLTVAAVNGDPDPPGLVNSSTSYTTYLEIKGADLLAFRLGKLTKDEARRLIDMQQR